MPSGAFAIDTIVQIPYPSCHRTVRQVFFWSGTLIRAKGVKKAARKLSLAEEIIGRAYAKIADHYDQVTDTYRMIASKFNALADNERTHRDHILRENERLKQNGNAYPPDSGR